MRLLSSVETRLIAFAECYQWVTSKSEAGTQLRIRMDELRWVLERTR
jgi:hypothetical protein